MPVKPEEESVNYPGWIATSLFQGALSGVIREHLALQNFSQERAARELGVNKRTVETNLSGDGDFRVSQLFRLAQVLGFDFADAVADALFETARSGLLEQRDELLDKASRIGLAAKRERDSRNEDGIRIDKDPSVRKRDHKREYMQKLRKQRREEAAAANAESSHTESSDEESETA